MGATPFGSPKVMAVIQMYIYNTRQDIYMRSSDICDQSFILKHQIRHWINFSSLSVVYEVTGSNTIAIALIDVPHPTYMCSIISMWSTSPSVSDASRRSEGWALTSNDSLGYQVSNNLNSMPTIWNYVRLGMRSSHLWHMGPKPVLCCFRLF